MTYNCDNNDIFCLRYRLTKTDLKTHLFDKSLVKSSMSSISCAYVGLGSYLNKSVRGLDAKILLCVKKEYLDYVRLCLFTNSIIEFDCFYYLIDKSVIELNRNDIGSSIYRLVIKYAKDYDIPCHIVDFSRELVSTTIEDYITNSKSISEMKNKLVELQKEALESWVI